MQLGQGLGAVHCELSVRQWPCHGTTRHRPRQTQTTLAAHQSVLRWMEPIDFDSSTVHAVRKWGKIGRCGPTFCVHEQAGAGAAVDDAAVALAEAVRATV